MARDLTRYNSGSADAAPAPPVGTELALARAGGLAMESYLLNSIFTHKCARYAVQD